MKTFLGNFYRHLAIFIWSHWYYLYKESKCKLGPILPTYNANFRLNLLHARFYAIRLDEKIKRYTNHHHRQSIIARRKFHRIAFRCKLHWHLILKIRFLHLISLVNFHQFYWCVLILSRIKNITMTETARRVIGKVHFTSILLMAYRYLGHG